MPPRARAIRSGCDAGSKSRSDSFRPRRGASPTTRVASMVKTFKRTGPLVLLLVFLFHHGLAAAQTTFAPDAEKRELVVAIYLAGAPISSVAAKGHLVSSLAAALTSAL